MPKNERASERRVPCEMKTKMKKNGANFAGKQTAI
jgi:hypothetical protein